MYPLPFCIDIRNRSCVDLSAFAAGLGRFGGNEAVSPAWQQGYRRFARISRVRSEEQASRACTGEAGTELLRSNANSLVIRFFYEEEYDVTDNGIRSDLLL